MAVKQYMVITVITPAVAYSKFAANGDNMLLTSPVTSSLIRYAEKPKRINPWTKRPESILDPFISDASF
jgi:hypothetical protein